MNATLTVQSIAPKAGAAFVVGPARGARPQAFCLEVYGNEAVRSGQTDVPGVAVGWEADEQMSDGGPSSRPISRGAHTYKRKTQPPLRTVNRSVSFAFFVSFCGCVNVISSQSKPLLIFFHCQPRKFPTAARAALPSPPVSSIESYLCMYVHQLRGQQARTSTTGRAYYRHNLHN